MTAMSVDVYNEIVTRNALTERVKRRKEEYLTATPAVCSERAVLATESWIETEGEPLVIRRAKLFKKILEGNPITIREGEIIVGNQTRCLRGINPEIDHGASDSFRKRLLKENHLIGGGNVRGYISREDKEIILNCLNYWEKKTAGSIAKETLHRLFGHEIEAFDEALVWSPVVKTPTARCANLEKVLQKGLKGVIIEAEQEMQRTRGHAVLQENQIDKLLLLQAMIICCQAVILWAQRYALLAQQMAKDVTDPLRKSELERIAEVCERVPGDPARNFHEALQSAYFCLLALDLELATNSTNPGRLDQYFYPLYKKDIEEGKITRQSAMELLALLWIKFQEWGHFGSLHYSKVLQGNMIMNVTIGGVRGDGNDASNEVTLLILELIRQLKNTQPHVSFRYHGKVNQTVFLKALETCRDHGGGIPAFFNDNVAIPGLIAKGIPLTEARDWGPQGCVERTLLGKSCFYSAGMFFSLPKVLEWALNSGIDPRTRRQLGLSTGDMRHASSFEEVYDAFKKQLKYVIEKAATAHNVWCSIRQSHLAVPYNSAILDGCLESGIDSMAAGARWSSKIMACIRPFGHANVANSLAAIKKVIFEERKLTMSELLDALSANFAGKESIRAMLLDAPKYGNDDDYVDDIMIDLFKYTEEESTALRNIWDEPYTISRQGLTYHYYFGEGVGALPDGRMAFTPLADGSVSPVQGTDMKGPTAVFNSAAKVDHMSCEGTLLNQKFSPASVKTRIGIQKWGDFVKTYFDRGGYHCQFNIVNKETLLDARAHPEKYRDLVIRVAGFSAYFVELSEAVQDEIIARTEQIS